MTENPTQRLRFRWPWRRYQARVLETVDQHQPARTPGDDCEGVDQRRGRDSGFRLGESGEWNATLPGHVRAEVIRRREVGNRQAAPVVIGQSVTVRGGQQCTDGVVDRFEGGGRNVGRLLHGEQRFVYHKPLHPGEVLTITRKPGKRWEKEGKRGGVMRFSETITEYRDEAGELVVTAIGVGIITGKVVEG